FANTQVVTMRRHHAEFREATADFDFFIPDGMPLVWCMNRSGAGLKDRVYGPTFFRVLATRSGRATHFLLGGSPETGARLRKAMQKWNPEVQVIGAFHGPCGADGTMEDTTVLEEINRLSPDFIWVALGTPKQQQWIHRHRAQIHRGVILSVGFAFDVNAGTKRDAPIWMQRRGLTWVFRMMAEPRRLATRYLRYNTLFVWYLLKGSAVSPHTENPPLRDKVNVLGVGVSDITRRSGLERVMEAIERRKRAYVCVTSVHGVMEAQQDERLRKILNDAYLCTPDGMPMVWMGKLQGHKGIRRVYGPDLMLDVCEASARTATKHFFYGGHDGVTVELRQKLTERFPGLNVVGTYEPPFRPLNAEEAEALRKQVEETKPDIFWVGLSTPKQERFMAEYLPKLNVTLMIGVGAAFDFHTGRVKQAPRWMQDAGLEWFYRVLQEPRRLAPRYLKNNPPFLLLAILQLLRLKRYSLEK
ncbi:MAG TPA: WecB/TagA/CpsF family glycosyltransferase, partial [Candidatus Saccharimonadales bacterium]|nr:WecB/TagA/CpsF family glycosyltransferase [Candidatus Saccharimonadales bacterium]